MATSLSFLFVTLLLLHISKSQFQVGFYSQTCPNAESIVRNVVREAALENPRVPPMLLRLHFHDCFVEGCDGSILIDNGASGEKEAFENKGLGGFEEVEKAKGLLEAECPGVVSCADIVAMAARDAVTMAGGPFYDVETGRRDGRVSSVSLADNMPDVNDSIETLKAKFIDKGLSKKELVLLSGAHTIGTTACFFMPKRLYNFSGQNDSDPDINPNFLAELKNVCPNNGDVTVRIPLDVMTVDKFDDQILHNIKNGIAVIASDARLYDDVVTKQVVDSYVDGTKGVMFGQDFAVAMVKMGRIGAKIGGDGEIRRVCSAVNYFVDTGADIPDEDDRGLHRCPLLPHEEEQETGTEERDAKSLDVEDDKEATDVEQQALLPSARDPKLWKVKCWIGSEREVAGYLLQNCIDRGPELQIRSAIALDHLKYFVYIEADEEAHVREAIKGIRYIYASSEITLVPIEETTDVLSGKSKAFNISRNSWVRLKSGAYKGDLAKVVDVDEVRLRAIVKLIPRIDLQALADRLEGREVPKKRAFIPPARLMNVDEARELHIRVERRRDPATGDYFEQIEGWKFKDGLLYKNVSLRALSTENL